MAAPFSGVPGAGVPGALVPGSPGGSSSPPPPAPAVTGTWTGSYAVGSGYDFPYPAARPLQVGVTNTAGDWLFALVAWRPSTLDSGVSVCLADDAHNWWEPLGAPAADSGAAGVVRTAVWAAPAARVANSVTGVTQVQAAPTGPVLSIAVTIIDVSGILPWFQVGAAGTNFAAAATSLSASASAPSASSLVLAAFAGDNDSVSYTWPSAGWTALTGATASNGVDHTADTVLMPAWAVTSSPLFAQVTTGSAVDLAGAVAGVLVSAPQPAQPNPYWPVMVTEAAIGSGAQTPPSEMTWTALSGRSLSMSVKQGRQYTLGQLQAGQGTLVLDDPDGALIPPGTGSYAGIDSGTPVRRRVTWPGLPGGPANPTPNYVAFSGFLRRWPWNLDDQMLRGKVQAELADIWAYGSGVLNDMGTEEALLDEPHGLWPLTDPAGSTSASNVAGSGVPLKLTQSRYGNGGATAVFGANSGVLKGLSSAKVTSSGASGGSTGMFQQTLAGTSLTYPGYGYALVAVDTTLPSVTNGVTAECWAQLQLGAVQRGGSSTTSPRFGGTASLPAGQAVVLTAVPGFSFPTGPSQNVIYFTLSEGTQYDLSTTPGGGAVGVSVNGSFYLAPTVQWNPVILTARNLGYPVVDLEVDKVYGYLVLRYRPAGALTDTLVNVDTSMDYRNMGAMVHFSLSFNTTSWRVLTNAGEGIAVTGTFSSPLRPAITTACFGGVMDRSNQGAGWTGYLGFAGVYPGFSQQARVVSRFWATGFGMVAETASDRVERLLEYGGLTGRRWIGQEYAAYEGDLMVSGQDAGGQAPVTGINNIVASTAPGFAYIAPTGDTVYRAKAYAWNEPVRWVLGDDTAGGEIPFAPGNVATDFDPTRVTEDVQLTQLDTQAVTIPMGVMSATTMTAVAAAAEGQYGGTPYQQTGYLTNDWSGTYTAGSSLVDLANWVQAVFRKPQNRIQSVTVDAAAYPAAWPFWAGASVGDMVTVNVRLPTAVTSPLISLTARITQTTRSSQFAIDQRPAAKIACVLDFAPEYSALTCDDPVRGLLNGSNVLAW